MTSKELVQMYDAQIEGQGLLWDDADFVLRRTRFKSINPEFDKAALIHWWMNVYIPGAEHPDERVGSQEVYSTWHDGVWKNFKYVMMNNYNPEINQQVVTFSGYKKDPIQPQIDELRAWLPYIKLCKDSDGREGKLVRVSSERSGTYILWAYSEQEYSLVSNLGFRGGNELAHFDGLGKTIWFITQHYYYSKRSNV